MRRNKIFKLICHKWIREKIAEGIDLDTEDLEKVKEKETKWLEERGPIRGGKSSRNESFNKNQINRELLTSYAENTKSPRATRQWGDSVPQIYLEEKDRFDEATGNHYQLTRMKKV